MQNTDYHVRYWCMDCDAKIQLSDPERNRKWNEEHLRTHKRSGTPCRLQVVTDHSGAPNHPRGS